MGSCEGICTRGPAPSATALQEGALEPVSGMAGERQLLTPMRLTLDICGRLGARIVDAGCGGLHCDAAWGGCLEMLKDFRRLWARLNHLEDVSCVGTRTSCTVILDWEEALYVDIELKHVIGRPSRPMIDPYPCFVWG